MKFNWKEFKVSDNIAVHCKTEEEAIDSCKQMHEHCLTWNGGRIYLTITNRDEYESETCYGSDGSYADVKYYEEENYTILEWSNYMNEEKENNMNLELNNLTEEQKNQIIELAKKFEQENEVDKLDYNNDWKPYGCIGSVNQVYGMNRGVAGDLFELGLTAHTKEEAEKIRNRLLVEKELRDWAKKCKEAVTWGRKQMKYYIAYDSKIKKIIIDDYTICAVSDILFTDRDILIKAIESIGQERLIRDYFGIDK